MKTLSIRFAIVLFCIIINILTPSLSAQPVITDIGKLFESGGSRAYGISPDGSSIVGYSYSNAGRTQAFIWTEPTQMVGLNSLNFGVESRANDISSDGKITGFVETNRGKEAVIWINNDPDSLRGFPPLTVNDEGTCISDNGLVIAGYFKNENMSNETEAFRWTSSSGLVGLGDLPGGGYYSYARGISADGTAIVGESYGANGYSPFIWNQVDGMKPLTYFDGTIPKGIAFDVSSDGKIVVGEVNVNDDIKPFLWTQGTGIVELGTNNSSSYLSARTISSDGKIITGTNGFFWDIVNGTRDFSQILYDFGIDNPDLYLLNITDISDNNQIFTGHNSLGKSFRIEITPYVKVTGLSPKETRITSTSGWTRPSDLILVDEKWDIHFSSLNVDSVNIYYSLDNGVTLTPIILNYSASKRKYEWVVPKILSTNCKFVIVNSKDPSIISESRKYKVKGIELTRYKADSTYEAFDPRIHGWSFNNSSPNMWPRAWWMQFDYNGIDPFTNENYSEVFREKTQPNSAHFPDWPLFVEIAEFDDCYAEPNAGQFNYRNRALDKWESIKGIWEGSCFGFAVATFLAFDHKEEFQNRFPNIGNFANVRNINLNNNVRKIINELFSYQYGKKSKDYRHENLSKKPVTTLNEIKIMLLKEDDKRELCHLDFFDNGGHSVNPYKVEKDPDRPEIEYVYVYDNNSPNDLMRRFSINKNANSWVYTWANPNMGQWEGQNRFLLMEPALKYLRNLPQLPKAGNGNIAEGNSNYLEIYNNYDASITITDSKGNKTGYLNNNYFNNLDDGTPIIPTTGYPHPPIGYYLPIDNYSIKMNTFSDSLVHCYVFTDTLIFSYNRNDAESNQTDIISFDNGFGIRNMDAEPKLINTGTVIVGDNYERSFDISNANMVENDSLNMIVINRKDIHLNNLGSEKTYSLRISQLGSTGKNIFENNSVLLPSNSACIFKPEWENMNGRSLTILVDYGNDGTINDSLVVQNVVTEINSEKHKEVLEEFVLHQNYPNPFNPTTNIKFDIKETSNVSLTVYDILGREVANLVNEQKPAGSYEVNFDASKLTSGIYIYTLRSNGFVQIKKMLLMK